MSPQDIAAKTGEVIGTSEWAEMSQERINQFADATGDHQFIHLDEEKAKMTPFGGTIAHGFLTLSMLVKMTEETGIMPENTIMGMNYGFDKIRFLAPVRAGKRVRAHCEIANVVRKDDSRFLTTQTISVEIEGEETPALVAQWLVMTVAG